MYNLCLIKDKKKLVLMSSKAQRNIDEFTINFDNESDLLNNYELDDSYKVVFEKEDKKGIKKLPFLSFKYRNIFSSIDNYYYFLQVASFNKDILEYYFEYETLRYENIGDNKFLKNKSRLLDLLLNNLKNKEYSSRKLAEIMNLYFKDMYSNFKDFYVTLMNNGFVPRVKEYNPVNFESNFDSVKEKIEKGNYKDIVTKEVELDDNLDELNYIINRDIDLDDKVSEIDMMTDNYSLNKKMSLINKVVGKKDE